jgi:hypothetical protein
MVMNLLIVDGLNIDGLNYVHALSTFKLSHYKHTFTSSNSHVYGLKHLSASSYLSLYHYMLYGLWLHGYIF